MKKNETKIETIVTKKEQMKCPICNSNVYVLKKINDEKMCIKCFQKKYPEFTIKNSNINEFKPKRRKPIRKLSKAQIEQIRKNIKDYRKSIGKVKILYGGCFN